MFFEAIAAVELANQAINGIKELASHVTSVGQMGKQLTQLADAHDELEKESEQGSMEAFWAFIYAGRPGLWDDYQTFIRNRKEMKRKAAERERLKKLAKKRAIKNGLIYTTVVLAGCLAVAGGIWLLLAIIAMKGR